MQVLPIRTIRSGTEARSAVRYQLRLPVIFHWNEDGEHTEGGFTSDVALDGALICSRQCPPVGSEVRIEVLIPSLDRLRDEVRIECVGKVTRVAKLGSLMSFGVKGGFDDDQIIRQVNP